MNSHFPLPIDGKFCPDNPRKFRLDADFIYDDPEKGIKVVVPAGFTTDFNSTPRAVWWYFAPTEYPEAGIVHDWLYRAPNAFLSPIYTPPLTRQQVDDIHRRILHLKGMRLTQRSIVYSFLRAGGWKPWNKYRAQDVVVEPQGDHK